MTQWIDETVYQGPVIGIDEVGRGPWAGPVMAVALYLNQNILAECQASDVRWLWVRDSKKVTPSRRAALYEVLTQSPCVQWALGTATVEEIDVLNIRQATLLAMCRAYNALGVSGGTLLIDGRDGLDVENAHSVPLVQGDSRSLSIAAASILAKVCRDQEMKRLHDLYPAYGWNQNCGYGTTIHHQAIQRYGITPHHRHSFKPIAHWASKRPA